MKKFKKKHIYIGLNLDLFGAIGTFILYSCDRFD